MAGNANAELFKALGLLAAEKEIELEYLIEKIKAAIVIAVKRDMGGYDDNIVEIDPDKKRFYVAVRKIVAEKVTEPYEILLADAQKYNHDVQIGDLVEVPLETREVGRIAAQTAKHVIRQGIREAEVQHLYEEFQSKEHEMVSVNVVRIDPRKGNVTVEMGGTETILTKNEQIPGEEYKEGSKIRVYISEVSNTERGPRIVISRSHPGFVRRLFEMQVSEVYDGTVEIKSIAREAGKRTKISVWSKDPNVDAVGSCIGAKGTRVAGIVEELGGEKIDVVKYSEDPKEFVAAALSPVTVLNVEIEDEEAKSCKVTVPDNQLSLAIGNKGQNARLAARLTGWKIDIRPESGFFGEDEE